MRISIWPETRPGRWAVGLFLAAVVCFITATTWPGLERSPDLPNILTAPVFSILMYFGFAASMAAAYVGLWSINKVNDKALLVYISIPLGVFYFVGIIVMIAGAMVNPWFPR
jgi:hypothetical protein